MSTVPAPPTAEHHSLLRERRYLAEQFEYVMLLVSEERFTGTVHLDCSQGGICAIRMQEQRKIAPDSRSNGGK